MPLVRNHCFTHPPASTMLHTNRQFCNFYAICGRNPTPPYQLTPTNKPCLSTSNYISYISLLLRRLLSRKILLILIFIIYHLDTLVLNCRGLGWGEVSNCKFWSKNNPQVHLIKMKIKIRMSTTQPTHF